MRQGDIPTLLSNGKEFNTVKYKARDDNFQSVFISENLSNIPSYHISIPSMQSTSISIEGIDSVFNKLGTNKSTGPDQIPSYALKHCAYVVAPILQVILTFHYIWENYHLTNHD